MTSPFIVPEPMRAEAKRALELRLRRLLDEIAACQTIATRELGDMVLSNGLEEARLEVDVALFAFRGRRP